MNKFPLLVRADHTVIVRLAREVRPLAGLAYAGLGNRPLPEGEVRLRDTADVMTFVACPPRRASRRGGAAADLTFWSGSC